MISDLITYSAHRAIREHFATRTSRNNGRDITHHEPVEYVMVEMSPRLLDLFLSLDDKPTEVDGIPLTYAEKPAPGVLDLTTMCHYRDERAKSTDSMRRSRGWVVRLPDEDFS